jgi:hypothetical protein
LIDLLLRCCLQVVGRDRHQIWPSEREFMLEPGEIHFVRIPLAVRLHELHRGWGFMVAAGKQADKQYRTLQPSAMSHLFTILCYGAILQGR